MFSSRKPYGLLKDFQIAEQMIQRLKEEPAFMNLYKGKEVIVTGQIENVNWKGKIDCLNLEDGYFVDIKQQKIFMNVNGMIATRSVVHSLKTMDMYFKWQFIKNCLVKSIIGICTNYSRCFKADSF